MGTNQKTARLAGLLYLIVVLTGIFNLGYVPGKLIVWNDASATVANLTQHELMFRLSIVSGIICYLAFLLLPLVLYKLLKGVHSIYAVLMVAFSLVSVPITLINMLNKFSVLSLISGAKYLNSLSTEALQTQVMFYLHQYENGNQLATIFWGLWLFPFGYLVFKSGFLPKILGILLMAGCFGYLIGFTGEFLFKDYNKTGISSIIHIPSSLGEIGTCLWLLLVGIRIKKQPLISRAA